MTWARSTKNSSRGRDEGFPADKFDSKIHHDRSKALENRGYTHERIIRFPEGEPDFFRERVEGLGLGFIYNAFVPINVTIVQEFCANFSSGEQGTVFLRGVWIPFTENDICHHLGIHFDLLGPGIDDAFVEEIKKRKEDNLDMAMVFRVIGREDTNWANDLNIHTIPEKKLDNAILNAHASAWHKLIMANIDPKTHGTTFDMDHAIMIYVLMTEGVVNPPVS
ncbi:hypothetical protein PIB30_076513 [Stylosanthes scabra]|uniref:Putative plant transposon protein domain-containing protein n=1 Tax=Stylosanthes scabra TaxID=79078 RepID=A0ABU6SR84_9FABA|nr:hypothetical protein [Stylosanthes scabra]